MRLTTIDSSSASWVTIVADEATKVAALMHPASELEASLDYLQSNALRLRYIFISSECHQAGSRELSYRTGAKVYILNSTDKDDSTFGLLKAGDVIEFGQVRFKVVPAAANALSLLVYDLAISDRTPCASWGGEAESAPSLSNYPVQAGVKLRAS